MIVSTRERVAFHESGHAAVAAALDCQVEYVTIVPLGTNLGACTYVQTTNGPRRVACHLGGAFAVWKFLGGRGEIVFRQDDAGDLDNIDSFLTQVWSIQNKQKWTLCKNPRAHEDWHLGYALAKKTVDDLWPAVTRVAYLLLERQTIRGKLVNQIVNEHLPKEITECR
jgi:ATP-dependent Zn protease